MISETVWSGLLFFLRLSLSKVFEIPVHFTLEKFPK